MEVSTEQLVHQFVSYLNEHGQFHDGILTRPRGWRCISLNDRLAELHERLCLLSNYDNAIVPLLKLPARVPNSHTSKQEALKSFADQLNWAIVEGEETLSQPIEEDTEGGYGFGDDDDDDDEYQPNDRLLAERRGRSPQREPLSVRDRSPTRQVDHARALPRQNTLCAAIIYSLQSMQSGTCAEIALFIRRNKLWQGNCNSSNISCVMWHDYAMIRKWHYFVHPSADERQSRGHDGMQNYAYVLSDAGKHACRALLLRDGVPRKLSGCYGSAT